MTCSAHDGETEITGVIIDPSHLQGLLERIAGDVAAGRRATIRVMSRRRRNKLRAVASSPKPAGPPVRPQRRDHMARVHVDDDTWRVFKSAAGDTPISELLGQLVTRHVHRHQAREAQTATIDDRDLLAALERATEFQRDLGWLVERLEHRLDRRAYH